MLPKLLTEVLCSLVSKVDRLAFSVFWEFTPNGEIVNTFFKKTIIHSKASLHYQQAYELINDANDKSSLTQGIRRLNHLAKIFRKKRIENGALTLAST